MDMDTLARSLAVIRDALLCVVLVVAIVLGLRFVVAYQRAADEKAGQLPDYCYAQDARAAAPECRTE